MPGQENRCWSGFRGVSICREWKFSVYRHNEYMTEPSVTHWDQNAPQAESVDFLTEREKWT
jgi:hypothetical protein